jgi:hypothetical protein
MLITGLKKSNTGEENDDDDDDKNPLNPVKHFKMC